jgi:hypothetical protein
VNPISIRAAWIASAVVVLLSIGFFRISSRIRALQGESDEVDDFHQGFSRYLESEGQDMDAYVHVTERAFRIQALLGPVGVMGLFRAPFGAYQARNWQIIVNALPALRREYEDGRGLFQRSRGLDGYAALLQETLFRYRGWIDGRIAERRADLRNPIVWLREGVTAVLLVPIALLHSLGMSGAATASFSESPALRVLAGLVTLIGLVGSVIGIVLDWSDFTALLGRLF